jgi:hypothetical protein
MDFVYHMSTGYGIAMASDVGAARTGPIADARRVSLVDADVDVSAFRPESAF